LGWRDLVHPDDIDDVARTSLAALQGRRGDILFRIVDQDDSRWLHGRLAPMRASGRIVGMVGVFDDVTAQREHEAKLAHQATHDSLTGLPNRVLLRDRLSQALGRISRTGEPVAALFVDLDDFKSINDRHGHAIGDQVLIETARRMLMAVRPTDTVARLGGDEFMIVSDGLDASSLADFCERMGRAIAEPIATAAGDLTVTAAIGVATVDGSATVDESIHQADAAMYRAKRIGPGSVMIQHLG
jgi:diguanylate cyclase (GGDEF)-like protein